MSRIVDYRIIPLDRQTTNGNLVAQVTLPTGTVRSIRVTEWAISEDGHTMDFWNGGNFVMAVPLESPMIMIDETLLEAVSFEELLEQQLSDASLTEEYQAQFKKMSKNKEKGYE